MLLDFDKLYSKYDLKIKGVLHIGAHFGQEDKFYKKHGIKNKIFFEPLPHTFQKLKENVKDGILINKALGSESGSKLMYLELDNQSQSSSFLKPKLHLTQYPWIKFNSQVRVEMVKLDEVEFDRNDYNFINIDVQGYEMEVFKGGIKTLETIDYIMTEVNRDEVYEHCARIEELDEFLKGYGFKRVEVDFAGITWGDAFYIKLKN